MGDDRFSTVKAQFTLISCKVAGERWSRDFVDQKPPLVLGPIGPGQLAPLILIAPLILVLVNQSTTDLAAGQEATAPHCLRSSEPTQEYRLRSPVLRSTKLRRVLSHFARDPLCVDRV